MIFYTLQGPGQTLEIFEDKLRIHYNGIFSFMSKKPEWIEFQMSELSRFEISVPQYIFCGKLEWQTFSGEVGTFKFSTSARMVVKIEKYIQKKVIKNHTIHMPLNKVA